MAHWTLLIVAGLAISCNAVPVPDDAGASAVASAVADGTKTVAAATATATSVTNQGPIITVIKKAPKEINTVVAQATAVASAKSLDTVPGNIVPIIADPTNIADASAHTLATAHTAVADAQATVKTLTHDLPVDHDLPHILPVDDCLPPIQPIDDAAHASAHALATANHAVADAQADVSHITHNLDTDDLVPAHILHVAHAAADAKASVDHASADALATVHSLTDGYIGYDNVLGDFDDDDDDDDEDNYRLLRRLHHRRHRHRHRVYPDDDCDDDDLDYLDLVNLAADGAAQIGLNGNSLSVAKSGVLSLGHDGLQAGLAGGVSGAVGNLIKVSGVGAGTLSVLSPPGHHGAVAGASALATNTLTAADAVAGAA